MAEDSLAETLMAQHEQQNGESSTSTTANGSSSEKKATRNGKFDIASLESFPSLGGAKKSQASSIGAWGAGAAATPLAAENSGAIKVNTASEVFTLRTSEQQQKNSDLIPNLLAKVKKLHQVSVESSTSKTAGTTTFIIKGSSDNVARSKRDIRKELAVRITKKVQVPSSARASIIGPKGSNLKPIIEKSGCAIQVAKADATPTEPKNDDDDEDDLVDVIIEGDAEGVKFAEDAILAIVKTKVRDLTTKARFDEKFKPFVSSQFGKTEGVKFVVPKEGPVVLSGERGLVLETKQKIEQFVQNAESTFATSSVAIPRAKLRVIDTKQVFDKTGVIAIVKDDVTIFGPPEKLKAARDLLTSSVENLNVLQLDISRAHGKNLAHAENLALYLQESKQLAKIQSDNSVNVQFPQTFNGENVMVEIIGASEDNIKEAKKNIVSLVNTVTPSHVKRVDDIDAFFRPQVAKLAKKLQAEHYVKLVMTQPVVIVYEGNPKQDEEDFAPGASEIQETVVKADGEFDDIRSKQKDIVAKVLTVPAEEHKYITGPNNTTLNALVGDAMVTIELGKVTPELNKDSVSIRGLKNEVDRIVGEIDQVIHEGKNYEELSKYVTEFTFPVEHLSKLIGRQGSNLSKLQDEFGVRIEVDEKGSGTVKGIKKNADAAKARILNQAKRVADEVTARLNIPSERHATLIGQGGKFVRRLEERYDVRVRFPRNDGASTKDDRDAPKHKDEVVLRGPSRNVAKVKEELLDLLKYEEENSYSETIHVPGKALPRIIGKQGEFINEIKDTTETRIDVAHDEADKEDGDKKVSITITGTKKGVKEASEQILAVARDVSDTVTEFVDVEPKYHKYLIGPSGSVMREIIQKVCGDDSVQNSKMIDIPPASSGKSQITVSGNKKYVSKVIKRINELVADHASRIETIVNVPVGRHGALIGPGGVVKREIESSFDVTLAIPQQNSGKEGIKVVGKQENVDKAKARIEELAASHFKAEVSVPKHLHALLSDRGALPRRLQSELDVRVEHGRGSLPKLSESTKAPSSEYVGEVLITDDASESASKSKWTIVDDAPKEASGDEVIVPWRLRGTDENCTKAKKIIEDSLSQVRDYSAIGYLWLADPSRYRLVIGQGGSRINKIRLDTSCSINVPKSNSGKADDVIIIRGKKENLDKAKEMILKSIK